MADAPNAVLAQLLAAVPAALAFVARDGSRRYENARMAAFSAAVRKRALDGARRAHADGLGFLELLDEDDRIWRFDYTPGELDGDVIVVASDVSETRRMEGRLEELLAAEQMARVMSEHEAIELARTNERLELDASTDPLTGLVNRRAFDEAVDLELARATDSGSAIAVIYFDLDKFKGINDTLGHGAGDAVLVETGARLQRCVRAGDIAARLGGDEFALLLCQLPVDAAAQVATRVGEESLAAISEDVVLGDIVCPLGASVGIAVGPSEGATREALVSRADEAMYLAKRRGGGLVVPAPAPAGLEPA